MTIYRIQLSSVIAVLIIAATPCGPAFADRFIKIGAHVDGRDQLVVQGNTLRWHHFDYAAVGRAYGNNAPTVFEVPDNRGLWTPTWPEPVPAEIRYEAYSSTLNGFGLTLPQAPAHWTVEKFAGLGEVHVVEQPSATNNHRLVVEFNDNGIGGPSFYWVKLSPVQPVVIDVRPWSRSNWVAPAKGGTIGVAVMSELIARGFDATQIVPSSARFGPWQAAPVSFSVVDVNTDGHQDVVMTFSVAQSGIACGDAEVELQAATTSGDAIEGRDLIRTIGCR
jgi:hypothetical protein